MTPYNQQEKPVAPEYANAGDMPPPSSTALN